ncbi:methylation-associated defense system AAA family ATPase MAD3 [Rhizohabitans arisaemae]|uniref:methylation-associated defense system AAA family ATPase MAD3 n=1 Tax=Rhizohabitans arisaemae TaxID=2720610 RepID=UPI0024B18EFF|nr:AAA family ATPase [Rhizohabitans arisaemae]
MITKIEAHNYRCFRELSIDLDRYHVLAGANGAGKTTMLDIPTLLGEMMLGGQHQGLSRVFLGRQRRGIPARASTLTELLHRGHGSSVSFAIEARLPDKVADLLTGASGSGPARDPFTHIRYELCLSVSPHELSVAFENLYLFSSQRDLPASFGFMPGRLFTAENGISPSSWQPVILRDLKPSTRFFPETTANESGIPPLRIPPSQPALGATPADPTLFPAALWFASLLQEDVVFFEPDWTALRRPVPPGMPELLEPSGLSIPWLALALQESDPERFASWVDHVRTALPQVERIRVVEREEDHHAYFAVEYTGGYRVTSSGLSDGTLRILALSLLPYLDGAALPRLLVTEEPENGIHPRAIETVVQSLSSLYDSQVWVSTHSPIVLAATDLADVLTARIDPTGAVTVIPGKQHPRLRDWQGSIDIGTLFAAGVLS